MDGLSSSRECANGQMSFRISVTPLIRRVAALPHPLCVQKWQQMRVFHRRLASSERTLPVPFFVLVSGTSSALVYAPWPSPVNELVPCFTTRPFSSNLDGGATGVSHAAGSSGSIFDSCKASS